MKTTLLSLVLTVAPWSIFAGNDAIENYVAHEWGTFTSVQGADGVLIRWNPLETTQLPKFVHDWTELKSGQDLLPMDELVTRISARMSEALEQEGLYRREADAMVKTWRTCRGEVAGQLSQPRVQPGGVGTDGCRNGKANH